MKNKKLIIRIICIVLLIAGCIGGYTIYQNKVKEKIYDSITIDFIENQVIEYGDQIESSEFIKNVSGEVTLPSIDTNQIGKQTLVYKVEKEGISKEFEYEIEIKDTQNPVITLKKDNITLTVGDDFSVEQYIDSINDPVEGTLEYKEKVSENDVSYYTYQSNVDTKKAGTYNVIISAADNHSNKTEKTLKVTVKEKEVENTSVNTNQVTTTSQNNNSSSTTVISKNKIVCIDAGHQAKGNNEKEPIGPGSSTKKAKVTTGATGVSSKKKESEINLEVALKLRDELQSRGYQVVMTRTSQNVNISNAQRAKIANNHNVSAVIHLHCDSIDNSSTRGAHTIAINKDNPYCSNLYSSSSSLAKQVIQAYCQKTGIKNRGVQYRNDLTGLNWSTVPSIYIEMGFISNATEDQLLSSSSFQNKCAEGIADGIDKYFQ